MGRVAALVENLLFFTRIKDAASAVGLDTVCLSASAVENWDVPAELNLLVVDLSLDEEVWQSAIESGRTHGVPVIAFGPHVETERLHTALRLGAVVFRNGRMHKDAETILRTHAANGRDNKANGQGPIL